MGDYRFHTFKQQLELLLRQRKMKKVELAEAMGVSGAYVSQILRSPPNVEQIVRVAKALKIEPQTFDAYCVLTLRERIIAREPWAVAVGRLLMLGDKHHRLQPRLISEISQIIKTHDPNP